MFLRNYRRNPPGAASPRHAATPGGAGRFLPGFAIVVLLALFASGAARALTSSDQGSAAAQLPAVQVQKDTLVVGSEQDYPPFATGMTDETAGGFTVELWKAVAAEAGLKYALRVRPFHQILQEFKQGKIDVLINLAHSDERRQFADFSVPHVIVNGAIFVRKGDSRIQSEEGLVGKSIIVLKADLAHDYAVSKGWQKQLILVDTSAEGFRLLAAGKHDAMLLSKLTGMQTLDALGLTNIEALKARAGFSQKFAFAVHKGQADLLAKLNEGMALTKSAGTYNALYEKWFGLYEIKEVGLRDSLKYIIPLALVFLSIGGYFFYRRRLERQEAELKLRTLYTAIEQSPISVVIADVDAKIEYANPRFTEVTGYTTDEATGQNPRILQSGLTPEETFRELWDKVTSGQVWHGELVNKRKNGEIYWEEAHIAPVKNEAGVLTHYVAAKVDITQRKLDQQRMEHLLAEQKAMLENDLVGIATSRKRVIVWANPALERMLGYDPGELVDTPARRNYPDEEGYLAFCAAADSVLSAGKAFRSEIELVRKDGRRIWVDVSGAILDPATEESLWAFIDITERRDFQRHLAQSEQRMELALEGADLGMWDLHIPSGQFTHNSRLVTMLGYAPGEVEANAKTFLASLHPDDAPKFGSAFYAHLKGETPSLVVEYRMRHKDDHWGWILSHGKVVERDDNGRAVRMTGTNMDISERKRTEAALAAREARLATLIASMQDMVLVFDTGGTVVEYFHPPHFKRPAYKPREYMLGKTYTEILPASAACLFDKAIVGIMTDGQPQTFEYTLVIDGHEYLSQATMGPLLGQAKYPTGFLAVIRDITNERSTRRELEHLARTNTLLLESVGEGIYGVDLNYHATFMNSTALAMLGFSEAELIGQEQHDLFHHHRQDGTPYPTNECPTWLTLQDGQVRRDENEWFWRKDGSGFPVALTVTPLIENGTRIGVVVIFRDISERKANEAKIHELAFYDPLTRLPNRRLLFDRLGLALPASARRNANGAILFLDLDNFKVLNDTKGHEFGDLLLVDVSQRLLACIRAQDTVARLGGDEFVVMLEDLSPISDQAMVQAEAIGQKICGELGAAYSLGEYSHQCTVSIGICLFKGTDVGVGELIRRADLAMYQAKFAGRNTIRFFQAS